MRSDPALPALPPALFRGLGAFFATELRVQLHERMAIVTSITVQVVLLIFVRILAPGLWSVALFGAVIFSFFTLGQRVLNEAAYIRVDHRLNQLYLASPLTPESYFLGLSLGVLVAYLLPIGVLVGVAVVTVPAPPLVWVVLPILALAVFAFSASIGYIVSTQFRDMRAIWSYASLLYNFFGVLPPVFYPVGDVPSAVRIPVLLLPPSGASALLQTLLGTAYLTGGEIALTAVALGVESTAALVLAMIWARRTVQEA